MDWGIYNDMYGDPWAMTYAGQFWAAFKIGGLQSITLSQRDAMVSPERPENLENSRGRVGYGRLHLTELSKAFQLACNLSRDFGDLERVQLEFSVTNVRGRWLTFNCGDSMGP